MKRFFIISLMLFSIVNFFGQIDMSDSTMQVIGYWDLGDKQSYALTNDTYTILNGDTTKRTIIKYNVDVTVLEATESSYIIEWSYKNTFVNSYSALIEKCSKMNDNLKIKIKTDEFGGFQEVVNWKELKKHIESSIDNLTDQEKNNPDLDKVMNQRKTLYRTKAGIEQNAIKEIQQFYTYHGGKYTLGEKIESKIKVANTLGGENFDCDFTLSLDELSPEDNDGVLRMKQVVDSKQLTEETYSYLKKMSRTVKIELPAEKDFPELTNETFTASRIHGSGWVIFTLESKEVRTHDRLKVIENIIELL